MKIKLNFPTLATLIFFALQACTTKDKQPSEKVFQSPTPKKESAVLQPDTITALSDQKDSVAFFKAPDGSIYRITLNDENGNPVVSADESLIAKDSLYCITDIYLGTKRKKSKTSFAVKTYKIFKNVAALKKTFVADSIMRNLSPAISSDSNSVRVTQEKRNVTITTAFIYAVSREDDNDFHVIIGDSLPYDVSKSITVEISGLPNPPNNATDSIQNTRTVFESFFGEKCSGAYTVFSPPIKISVNGSLFFDIDHAAGIIGTGIYKPETCWEIHPVNSITFK